MHICVCVCVIFLHHSVWYVKSVVLFSSSILSLWYVGYDDFISMNNVFVFVLIIIIISLLVLLLANMKINILEKSPFSISDEFLYFSLFIYFIYFCISSKCIFLINYCFSFFLFSSVFIFSLTLIFFFLFSLSQSVGTSFYESFSFSFSLYHCQSLYDITRFDMIYCIIWYCIWQCDICASKCNITEYDIDNNV